MPYEPLHHKYRPQTFGDLVGQDAIATTLTNAILSKRIAPAYLFTGPRGTGKTSSARILAKSLNCLESADPTDRPCGTCRVCRGIELANGSALDVIEIDAASNTGVDNIRDLIEKAQFAPVQCRYKVYVIDECLTGNSLVQTSEGLIRIDDPNIKGKKVLSYNESLGNWEFKKVIRWLDQGERQTLVIKTTNRTIKCTGNHLIRTDQGWIPAKNLKEGMKILSPVNVAAASSFTNLVSTDDCGDLPEVINFAGINTVKNPSGTWMMDRSILVQKDVHQFNCTQKDSRLLKIKLLPIGLHQWGIQPQRSITKDLTEAKSTTTPIWAQTRQENGWQTSNSIQSHQWITSLEKVESVKVDGLASVYDIEVEGNHNFVANGILVHNCHMLSSAAFNALLKTLEEPPNYVVFILATTDPQRVLPTVISRCQRFDFRRIPLESMVNHLGNIAAKENIDIAPDALTLVAQVAQGGLRDAESLLDQLSLLPDRVTVEGVWDLVGAVPERDLMALLSAIADKNGALVLDITRRLMDRGREPLIVLQNLAGFYRDLLIAQTAPSRADLVACTEPTWNQLCLVAQKWDIAEILAGQKHLKDSEVQLKNSTQPRLWLEVTLLGLLASTNSGEVKQTFAYNREQVETRSQRIAPPPTTINPPIETPKSQPIELETTTNSPPSTEEPVPLENSPTPTKENDLVSPTIKPAPAVVESSPSIRVETTDEQTDLEQIWEKVIAHIQPFSNQNMLRQLCRLVGYDNQTQTASVSVRVSPYSKKSWFEHVQNRKPSIEAAFQSALKVKVNISLKVEQNAANTKNTSVSKKQTASNPTAKTIEPPTSPNTSFSSKMVDTEDNEDDLGERSPSTNARDKIQSQTPMKPPALKAEEVENPLSGSGYQSKAGQEDNAISDSVSDQIDSLEIQVSEDATSVEVDDAISTEDSEIDELAQAQQRIAKFFPGKLVKLTDDLELTNPVSTTGSSPDFKPDYLPTSDSDLEIEDKDADDERF